jgi:hypothetical protein
MAKLIETTILYSLLVLFAIYGVFWGVPKVAEQVEGMLVKAASVK